MKSLSQALDMPPLVVDNSAPPLPIVQQIPEKIELTEQEKQAEEDFGKARATQTEIIGQGMNALQEAMAVAVGSQQPRAFEVVATILKNLTDANQGLMALHESRRALTPSKEAPKESANTINNNTIIVSSPAELLDMVYQKRKMQEKLDHESE